MGQNGGGFVGAIGARAERRAEPRMWVTIAAVGCALAVFGLFLISGDAQAGDGDGDGSNVPGIVLCLLVVLAGYALMQLLRDAPAASAGVTAVILGLPALALFLTIDVDDVPPFSIELFLGLPALVWGVSYLVGPGKGRPVLLGFALVFAWLFVLQVVEDPFASGDIGTVVEEGIFDEGPVPDDFDDPSFDEELPGDDGAFLVETAGPDPTTIGWISVVFGAGYFALARRFDKRRLAGAATPFVVAGHAALVAGIILLSDDLEATGVGLAFFFAGIVVARLGALSGRRVTTIIGAVEIGLGAAIVLGDSMDDASATGFGTALFVLGAAIAVLAQVFHLSTGEPPQTTPGPSSFPRWSPDRLRVGTTPAGGAPGPWAGPPTPGSAPGPWAGPSTAGGAPSRWAPPPAAGPTFAPPPPPPPPPAPEPPAHEPQAPAPAAPAPESRPEPPPPESPAPEPDGPTPPG
jgi:hypothetical protein